MEELFEKINKSALKLLIPQTLDDLYKTIVEEAKKLMNADYGAVFLKKDNDLKRVYASDGVFYKMKVLKSGEVYRAFRLQKAFVGSAKKLIKLNHEVERLGIHSAILMPLTYKYETIGVLKVYSKREEHFSKRELEVLTLFGAMVSLAIKKAESFEETKKALETRDLFISLASHELRTPLTSLNGYIQLLHRKMAGKDTVEAKWVNELYEESKRLTNLVKELLEINRIKTGQLQYVLEACEIMPVIEKTIERITFTHIDRKIIVKNSIPTGKGTIIGDPNKLMQMFTALIENALKFSYPHTPIHVTMLYKKPFFIFQIVDKGEGIDKMDIPYVFEEFYKGKYHKQREGLGVGLLLAKHIATYHHGSVVITSEIAKGTTVEVKIPEAVIEEQ